jgi:hypothetical protein
MSTDIRNFLLLFSKFFRKISMKEVKGLTLKEIADMLAIPENTAKVRMFRAGIEPLFRGALYPLDTPDRIREAPMGRPPKKSAK